MSDSPPQKLTSATFSTSFTIDWGDCDADGLVYFPNFFRWFDTTFQRLLKQRGQTQATLSQQFGIIGTALVDVGATAHNPARFDEALVLSIESIEWKRSTFRLAYSAHVKSEGGSPLRIVDGYEVRAFVTRNNDGSLKAAPIADAFKALLTAPPPKHSTKSASTNTDAALRNSEARLAGILAIAAEAIISIDDTQRITMFNHGAESIFGYTSKEVLGQTLEILMPQRFRASHSAHVKAFSHTSVVARRMGERSEIYGLRKNGQEFIAEASISKQDHEGDRTFTVVLRDITERVTREKALQASEERLGLALRVGHIGLFEHDHTCESYFWSPTFRDILGIAADADASISAYFALVPAADRERITLGIAAAQDPAGNGIFVAEHRIVTPTGTTRWIHVQAETFFNDNSPSRQPLRTVGAVLEITERKLIEEQLERRVAERTAELSAVFDAVPDGIITTSADRSIRVANATSARMFGYSPAEFVGMREGSLYASLTDDEDMARAWRTWEREEAKQPITITCSRKDGSRFPAMATGSAVRDEHGTIVSRVALIRDITDDLKRQKALTQAQRMEAYGQLTGGVAHDFNNLLTVITGNQELLEMRLRDPKDLSLLRRSQEAAEMGARLTARLLTFARRRHLEPTLLNLNDQITGMVELLRRSIGEQIRLSTNLSPALWSVRADASEIENAVLNLAINARDAMPKGGHLVIETKNCSLDDGDFGPEKRFPPGQYVQISVSDSGMGMTPDIVQRAMEPFFTTKPHGRGTGLGLSTIYGFVQQSGGTLTIYSEPGRGSTINLYLPRATDDSERSRSERSNTTIPMACGETILVVEDNASVREIAIQRLEGLGYVVRALDTGAAALELLKTGAHGINLVFSDVVMPGGISGYDLARWISEYRPELKILLTSGYPDEVARMQSGPVRAVRLLRKPYNRMDLAHALREAIDSSLPN
jgi:PAS domain S-box-containing protein